jgi:hypothetical protein
LPSIAVGVIVAVTSVLVGSRRGDIQVDVALASIATFLFGVLIAFTIGRTRERLVLIQNLLAQGNAGLFAIHQMMEVFEEPQRDQVRHLVDSHLIDQVDYRLIDYHRASPSFRHLTSAVYALRPQTDEQKEVYRELVGLCIEMTKDRALIEAATGQSMSLIEWSGLSLLFIILLGLISVLPGGAIVGSLAAGVLAGTLWTLMSLLRKLDLLRWHERVAIWEPTTRLFRSIGMDPYVPKEVIDSGRYRPTGRIRVVEYQGPYPNRKSKAIRVEELGVDHGAPDVVSEEQVAILQEAVTPSA